MFEIEDLMSLRNITSHAQQMIHYLPTSGLQKGSEEFIEQFKHLEKSYHIVDCMNGIRLKRRKIEVKVKWLCRQEYDSTWRRLDGMKKNRPRLE